MQIGKIPPFLPIERAIMTVSAQNLVWIDMEMTGLDPEENVVLEIATIITDKDLNVLAQGPVIAIHQSDEELAKMDDWNVNTHTKSGLVARVKASEHDEARAVAETLDFIRQWVPERTSPLCGNSIGQDRRFMVKHMGELEAFFHYRNVDVSTIKELVRRWQPELLDQFTKSGSHQALDDIRESIAELQFYRSHVFKI
jgi:oligoribonuclease